jgi:hypothetical protein
VRGRQGSAPARRTSRRPHSSEARMNTRTIAIIALIIAVIVLIILLM